MEAVRTIVEIGFVSEVKQIIDGNPIIRSDLIVAAVETPAVRGTWPKVVNQRRIRLVLFSDPDPDEAVPFVHDEGFGANVPIYRIGLDRHLLGNPVWPKQIGRASCRERVCQYV